MQKHPTQNAVKEDEEIEKMQAAQLIRQSTAVNKNKPIDEERPPSLMLGLERQDTRFSKPSSYANNYDSPDIG